MPATRRATPSSFAPQNVTAVHRLVRFMPEGVDNRPRIPEQCKQKCSPSTEPEDASDIRRHRAKLQCGIYVPTLRDLTESRHEEAERCVRHRLLALLLQRHLRRVFL